MCNFFFQASRILNKEYTVNPYLLKLRDELKDTYFDYEQAVEFKGKWKKDPFGLPDSTPMDLEIGTGNGFFFAHHCFQNPNRAVVGLEIKYKPLHQTLKRADSLGCTNGRGVRMHASQLDQIFAPNEVDNTYIFFPDPWPKKRHHKNRLIQLDFLHTLFEIQKVGSFLEFKTDNPEYFDWTVEKLKKSPYKIERITYDLHTSEWAQENFQTHFEKLWTSKGLKTMLVRAYKL
jgi:tRNA (guanine-N7-)-methyltransferase